MNKTTNNAQSIVSDFQSVANILENGNLVKAEESKERVFCGYYAAVGYREQNPGDLFAMLSGTCLSPCYDTDGNRLNVGAERAGMRYSSRLGEWYHE